MSGVAHTIALCALLGAGCAAATHGPADTAQAYRELRRAEAELERGLALAGRSQGAERKAHVQAACSAANDACEIADTLEEGDAALRCDAAERRCREARAPQEAP